MATDTLTNRELDAFRDDADRFIAELDEEYYLHFAGHKETLEVEAIYERHEELTKLETAKRLEGAPTELWRFACEGYLGNLTRSHQEKLATVEAELEATVDGETIPFRMLRVEISNEPDRDRRERLEQARLRLLDEHLNPVYLDAARIDHEAVSPARLAELLRALQAVRLPSRRARRECTDLLDETERLWEEAGDRLFRERLGIGLADARPWDVARLFRAPELDKAYPSGPDAAGARGDAARPRDRPRARRRTSTSTSSSAREEPARVLRADRGAGEGDARDPADRRARRLGGALPRGRPHRALREHLGRPADGGEAASATWRSPRAGRC